MSLRCLGRSPTLWSGEALERCERLRSYYEQRIPAHKNLITRLQNRSPPVPYSIIALTEKDLKETRSNLLKTTELVFFEALSKVNDILDRVRKGETSPELKKVVGQLKQDSFLLSIFRVAQEQFYILLFQEVPLSMRESLKRIEIASLLTLVALVELKRAKILWEASPHQIEGSSFFRSLLCFKTSNSMSHPPSYQDITEELDESIAKLESLILGRETYLDNKNAKTGREPQASRTQHNTSTVIEPNNIDSLDEQGYIPEMMQTERLLPSHNAADEEQPTTIQRIINEIKLLSEDPELGRSITFAISSRVSRVFNQATRDLVRARILLAGAKWKIQFQAAQRNSFQVGAMG